MTIEAAISKEVKYAGAGPVTGIVILVKYLHKICVFKDLNESQRIELIWIV